MENNKFGNAFNLPPNLLKYTSTSGLRDKMGKAENQHQPLTDVGRLASSIGMSGPTPKARFAEAVAQSQQIPNHIYAPDGRVGGVQNPFDPMVEPGLPNPTRGRHLVQACFQHFYQHTGGSLKLSLKGIKFLLRWMPSRSTCFPLVSPVSPWYTAGSKMPFQSL